MAKKVKKPDPLQEIEPMKPPESTPPITGASADMIDADEGSKGKVTTGLSEAIRKALETLGTGATGPEVRSWIDVNYPDVDTSTASFSSSFSNLRKKVRGDVPGTVTSGSTNRKVGHPQGPTVDDLGKVWDLCEGDVEAALGKVQDVFDWSMEVGGIDALLKCLEALRKFSK